MAKKRKRHGSRASSRASGSPRRDGAPTSAASATQSTKAEAPAGRRWALLLVVGLVVAVLAGLALVALRHPSPDSASTPADGDRAESTVATDGSPPLPENLEALDRRMREAVREAAQAVESAPESSEAWGRLGRVYHAHKYFDLALECYRRARALDPDEADWPYYLGVFAGERGDLDSAIELLSEARQDAPDDATIRYRLGDALLRAGRLDEAERELALVRERAPEASWGHLALGRVARARENWRQAVEHLESARRIAPRHHEVLYLLAQSYRELERNDQAAVLFELLDDAERVLYPDPRLGRAFAERSDLQRLIASGNQRLAEGAPEEAERLYREVLRFEPGHFDALFNLGVLYGRGQRFEEAAAVLGGAVEARPDHVRARFLLALSLANLGRVAEARRHLEEVLRREPGDEEARGLLQQLPR